MIKLIDYPNYGYEDGKVYNIVTNTLLKPHLGSYYLLFDGKRNSKSFSIAKIAYCALNGISLFKIPKGTVFVLEDGVPKVISRKEVAAKAMETFKKNRKITLKDIDDCIEYLEVLRKYTEDKSNAEDLYKTINKKRSSCIKILMKRLNMREDTAELFVDEVIMQAFTNILNGMFIVVTTAYLCRAAIQLWKTRRKEKHL